MMRMRTFFINVTVASTSLLLFLLLFEEQVAVPAWLQVAGRMHPLILHFPIVLIILCVALLLFLSGKLNTDYTFRKIFDGLLLSAACAASLTAVLGLLLSREEGYDAEALQWHKWSGLLVPAILVLAYSFRGILVEQKGIRIGFSSLSLLCIVMTGHQGAGLTHGNDFLFAPVIPQKQSIPVTAEEALVYDHLVMPVLESKCISCHNAKKAKGNLVMETKDLLLRGGKSGKLWDPAAPDLGLLLRRIHLPSEDKKHMPPPGKPQLSEEEMALLYHWIKGGASFTGKVMDLDEQDTLRMLANELLLSASVPAYTFKPAADDVVKKLNNANRVVMPISADAPALSASFYNSAFYSQQALEELTAVQEQLVSLDLSRMPVTDDQLAFLARFIHLEKLNLNFTSISGSGLAKLLPLKRLRMLSLAGTPISKSHLDVLDQFPALRTVAVWNTQLSRDELTALAGRKKPPFYETGFYGDTLVMQLTPPLLQNEEQVLSTKVPLRIRHFINGAELRYTTDGSEPDSVHAPLYRPGVFIEGNTLVKVKAYKPGWISSETVQRYFFRSTYRPDSMVFVQRPDPKYTSEGPKSLFNALKGDANFGSGLWLGYRENKMESLLFFKKPVPVQSVTFSYLVNSGSYIMPPAAVEVWTGSDPQHLTLARRYQPVQPGKYETPVVLPAELKLDGRLTSCIKLVAVPVAKLPRWHGGKGDKGWVFIDEVFIN